MCCGMTRSKGRCSLQAALVGTQHPEVKKVTGQLEEHASFTRLDVADGEVETYNFCECFPELTEGASRQQPSVEIPDRER